MKTNLSFIRSACCLLVVAYCLQVNFQAKCQEKLPLTMNVSYKITDGTRNVSVDVWRKENRKIITIDNVKAPVNLYLNAVKENNPQDGTGLISKIYLNEEGKGMFEFPADFNTRTAGLHTFNFIVKMENDPLYEDAEEEITISDAVIRIEYSGEDSIKTATATLSGWKDSAYVPVPEAELRIFIKRSFSLFPIGEEGLVTDEEGKVMAELPLDIPGDFNGMITLSARLSEHDSYGTVETTRKVSWDIVPTLIQEGKRTLWSSGSHAPIPLLVTALSIVTVIWGILIYLVFQLFKIKKIGKQQIQ